MPQFLKITFALAFIAVMTTYFSYDSTETLTDKIASDGPSQQMPRVQPVQPKASQPTFSSKRVQIDMAGNGHFVAEFRINGRGIPSMIDTGASIIALNVSQARSMGINLKESDFTLRVDTANGTAKAAPVTLRTVQVGGISIHDVRAAVLEDKALSAPLIGMSFLSRLKSYQVQNSVLTLQQ